MTPGRGQFGPQGLVGRIYVVDHYYTLLHTEYLSSGSHGFGEEDLLMFSRIILWEFMTPVVWPIWTQGA